MTKPESYIEKTDTGTVFVGERATRLYQAVVVKTALQSAKLGIRVNLKVSSAALLRTAGKITGKIYGRRAFGTAIADLENWIVEQKSKIQIVVSDKES